MKQKALFNINRLVADSGRDTSPEVSFLQDLDYTLRKMNSSEPHYYFKKISPETDPEYFDTSKKMVHVVGLKKLPDECTDRYFYDKIGAILHTNEQQYYVCLYSDGKPSRRYKPSSLHCMRNMYFQVTGAELDKKSDKTGDFYGICESGEDRHIRIQRAISNMAKYGVECEYVDVAEYIKEHNIDLEVVSKKEFETKLYDAKRNLIFLCDGILKYKGKYYILEIKTETSFKWMDRNAVDPGHNYQSYAYSLELGIEDVLFLYENRDICTKKSFMSHITEENREEIANRLSKCDEYVKQKIVPPMESNVTSKVCQYCEYKSICKTSGR